jgi:hypothetical protein
MEGVGTRAFKPPLQLERAETMGRIGIRRRDRGNLFADFYNKICHLLTHAPQHSSITRLLPSQWKAVSALTGLLAPRRTSHEAERPAMPQRDGRLRRYLMMAYCFGHFIAVLVLG